MALVHAELIELAELVLEVVEAQASTTLPIDELAISQMRLLMAQQRLKPTRREMHDVFAGVAVFHRQQAVLAEKWMAELRIDPGRRKR
jgi:hypothetical protein